MIFVPPSLVRLDLAPSCVGVAIQRAEAWEIGHVPNRETGLWYVDGPIFHPIEPIVLSEEARSCHMLPELVYPVVWRSGIQYGGPAHLNHFLCYDFSWAKYHHARSVLPFWLTLTRNLNEDVASWSLAIDNGSQVMNHTLPRYDPDMSPLDELSAGEVLGG